MGVYQWQKKKKSLAGIPLRKNGTLRRLLKVYQAHPNQF
jgi:hypothetical protein